MRGATAGRYLLLVAVGWGLISTFGPAWRSGYPTQFPDSSSYLDTAAHGPWSPSFWFAQRPPTYPLLVWLTRSEPRTIVVVQLLVAVAAWGWLAATAWRHLRQRAVAAATVAMLATVAVQSRWAFWHAAILTESLSSSLTVAGVAAWWRWFEAPSRFRLVAATAVTGAWMLLRDSNAVTFFAVAVPALVTVLVLDRRTSTPRRSAMASALAVLCAIGLFSIAGQLVTDRGETSLHNNVGLRWLVDDDMSAWMQARGMPMSDALAERAGGDAWADGEAFLRSPELAEYRAWADSRGRVAAAMSFVIRADWYLDLLWRDLPRYTASNHFAYDTFTIGSHLPERPLGPLDPVGSRGGVVVWSLLIVGSAAAIARFDRQSAWLVPFLAVPVVSDLYLSYVADAVEVGRHLVGPMFRFEIVAVVSVALGVDRVLTSRWCTGDAGGVDPDFAAQEAVGV